MSTTIDEHVVKMTFDNAQFERNVKTTMNTLDAFEKKLDMKGAVSGFNEVEKAANNLNLSALGKQTDEQKSKFQQFKDSIVGHFKDISKEADNTDFSGISNNANKAFNDASMAANNLDLSGVNTATDSAAEGFNVLETIATGVLYRIGSMATDFAIDIGGKITSFFIDPIKEGFQEYETQMSSIQTILANTGGDFDSDEDIQEVNDALDELNRYADNTIYNFTEMTKAVGTFTAAGLSLEEAVAAVQGSANVAALMGASRTNYSMVLPQLAQALSAGQVTLQDWRSVENANMGGRMFQQAIADMAVHMAQQGLASSSAYDAGMAILNGDLNIRQALNKVDYEDWAGWFTSNILSETFASFTFDPRSATADEIQEYTEHLKELGYQTEEVNDIFKRATMATRAATEVRTLTQLMETLGEAVGSNWAGIWRNFIGDFKQATDTFTFLSNTLSGGVDGLLGGMVTIAREFNKSGAIDLIFGSYIREYDEETEMWVNTWERNMGAIDYILQAIQSITVPIAEAFGEIFSFGEASMDQDGLPMFAALREDLTGAANAFLNFTQSLVLSEDGMIGLRQIFEGIFSVLDLVIRGVLTLGAAFGKVIEIARIFIDPLIDIALALGGSLGVALYTVHDLILLTANSFTILATEMFGGVIPALRDTVSGFFKFVDIPGKIRIFTNVLVEIINLLWDFIDIPGKLEWVLTTFKSFSDTMAGLFTPILDSLSNFFGGIKDAILDAFPFIRDWYDKVTEIMHAFDGTEGEEGAAKTREYMDSIKTAAKEALSPLGDLLDAIKGFLGRMWEFIKQSEALAPVRDTYNTLKDTIIGFFKSIPSKIDEAGKSLQEFIKGLGADIKMGNWMQDTIDYFNNLTPEKAIEDITHFKDVVKEKFGQIKEIILNFDITDVVNKAFESLEGFVSWIEEHFPQVGEPVRVLYTTMKSFFNMVSTNGITVKDVFERISKNIRTFLTNLPGPLGDLSERFLKFFDETPDAAKTAVSVITGVLSKIPGVVGVVFSAIHLAFSTLGKLLLGEEIDIPESFSTIFGGIEEPVKNAEDKVEGFWEKFKPENIGETFKGFGDKVKGKLSEEFGKILDFIKSIPERFKAAFDMLGEILSSEQVERLLNIIKTLVEAKVWSSLSTLIKGIGNQLSGKKDFSERIRNIALSILAIAAAVYMLGTMDPEQLKQAGAAIVQLGIVLVAMMEIPALLEKHKGLEISEGFGSDILKAALSLLVVSWGIRSLLKTVQEIQAMDPLTLLGGFVEVLIAIGSIGGILKWVGPDAMNAGIGILAVAIGMKFLASALADMKEVFGEGEDGAFGPKNEALGWALVGLLGALAEACIALAAVAKLVGPDATAAGIALLIVSAAIWILAQALASLDGVDPAKMIVSMLMLVALIGAFVAVCMATEETDLATTAGSLVAFALSVGIIAEALSVLATYDLESLLAAGVAIAGIVAAFALVAAVTKESDLAVTAAALLIFSLAVGVLSISLMALAQVDSGRLIAAAGALAIIMGVFGALAFVLSLPVVSEMAVVILPLLAVAFIALGAAALLIGAALNLAVMALQSLVDMGPQLIPFIEQVAAHIIDFGLAAVAFAALGAACIVLGAGLLVFGAGALVAGVGLISLSTGIRMFLELIADLPTLIENAVNGIFEFITSIPDRLGEFLGNIVNWFQNEFMPALGEFLSGLVSWFMDEFIPGIVNGFLGALDFLLNEVIPGFGNWVTNDFMPACGGFLDGIVTWFTNSFIPGLGELLDKLINWLLTDVIGGIQRWVTDDAIPAIQGGITSIMDELGGLLDKLFEWASGIPGAIRDGIGDILSWAGSIGTDILNGIIDGVTSAPGAIADAVTSVCGGALDSAASFLGINSPSRLFRDEIGMPITEGIAVGIQKNAALAVSAASKLASRVTSEAANSIHPVSTSLFDFGSSSSPSINPVIDMGAVRDNLDSIAQKWEGINLSNTMLNAQNVDAFVDMSSLNKSNEYQLDRMSALIDQNQKLLDEINLLRDDMATYTEAANNSNIVMDSGALVGVLAPGMDNALGSRQRMAERGVYR